MKSNCSFVHQQTPQCLSVVAVISINAELAQGLSYDDLINDFGEGNADVCLFGASCSCRKMPVL